MRFLEATDEAVRASGFLMKQGGVVVYPTETVYGLGCAPDGTIKIADRSKDLIKSGGEWISSVDLENALMSHPDVLEAVVVGVPHPKWQERPLAVVVPRGAAKPSAEELRAFLSSRFAKWQLPDAFVFSSEIPKTSVGKFLKTQLR